MWAGVNEHGPGSVQQRCTNHGPMIVIHRLPKAEQSEPTKRLRAIWQAVEATGGALVTAADHESKRVGVHASATADERGQAV